MASCSYQVYHHRSPNIRPAKIDIVFDGMHLQQLLHSLILLATVKTSRVMAEDKTPIKTLVNCTIPQPGPTVDQFNKSYIKACDALSDQILTNNAAAICLAITTAISGQFHGQ